MEQELREVLESLKLAQLNKFLEDNEIHKVIMELDAYLNDKFEVI